MREEMILEGDKPVHIRQTFAIDKNREILARGHACARGMFGANYRAAVEPICEDLRELMTKLGCDAITVGWRLVDEMIRIGEVSACSKAITMAAIYEVDHEECPNRN